MQLLEHKDFRKGLNRLWRRGGPYQKAADQVYAFLGRVNEWDDPFHGLKVTKHGESRIAHCVKYDLSQACRLITVRNDGFCVLLFCGDHEEAESWIEANRGIVPVLGGSFRVTVTRRSRTDTQDGLVSTQSGHYAGKLFERLPEELFEALITEVPRKVVRALEQLESDVTTAEVWTAVAEIEDGERRGAVHDVFEMLKCDDVAQAVARIKMLSREMIELVELSDDELPALEDSDVIRRVDPTSPGFVEALQRNMRTTHYRDWMLFMHPDQEAIATEDLVGPAKLVGVSGSGKTCVVVQRAVWLASRYPEERILILTLNRALAMLIDELVTACAPDDMRQRIDALPFFAVCRDLVLRFEPGKARHYGEVTWKTNEHIDEVWQEYYRCETNNNDAQVFHEVHDSLLARGWNGERYLREEVDWLRSALEPDARADYLEIERKGRTVPLIRQHRQLVLEGTKSWEEKMGVVGAVDGLGMAQHVIRYLDQIQPKYRCLLVDEVQDFGTVELKIIRTLVPTGANDLFLCGDAAQAVTTKHQAFRSAGIDVTGRSRRLNLNYRNSRDVLSAAFEVLEANLTEEMIDREDLDILQPELTTISCGTPLLLSAGSLADELRGAFAAAENYCAEQAARKLCVAVCGFSLHELTHYGEFVGVPVLDGRRSLGEGNIFLSDLEQTKGFEFDMMIIVNCSHGVLPDIEAPDDERFRDLARLYVAMTRAKLDLIISWSGAPTAFVNADTKSFLRGHWNEYVDWTQAPDRGLPRKLERIRSDADREPWEEMNAERFLRSSHALGVSAELSAKMRYLVDGKGLRKGKRLLKYRTMRQAADALKTDPRSLLLWGPEVAKQFRSLLEKVGARQKPVA